MTVCEDNWSAHKAGAIINGISDLSTRRRCSKKDSYESPRGALPDMEFISAWSWTSSLQNCETDISVAYKPSGIFVIATQIGQDTFLHQFSPVTAARDCSHSAVTKCLFHSRVWVTAKYPIYIYITRQVEARTVFYFILGLSQTAQRKPLRLFAIYADGRGFQETWLQIQAWPGPCCDPEQALWFLWLSVAMYTVWAQCHPCRVARLSKTKWSKTNQKSPDAQLNLNFR